MRNYGRIRHAWVTIFLAAMAAAVATAAPAAEIGGLVFDDQVEVDGRILALRGLALKEATFFRVDVYAMGLYTAETHRSVASLRIPGTPCVLVVKFLRDIPRQKLAQSWLRDLRASCRADCPTLLARAEEITRRLRDIRPGDTMKYVVRSAGVEISFGENRLGELTGATAAEAVLGAVFGERAPKQLRDALLGPLGPERDAGGKSGPDVLE